MKLCYIILVTEPLGSAKSAGEPSGKNSLILFKSNTVKHS